jgi:hypothetical protein
MLFPRTKELLFGYGELVALNTRLKSSMLFGWKCCLAMMVAVIVPKGDSSS